MPHGQRTAVLQHVRTLLARHVDDPLRDAALLERFASCHDESAFVELVRRHGPLVLSACRRVLHHEHDAEDAFQGAFLILAHQAASIRHNPALESWLYQVAYRTAPKAKLAAARRQRRENEAARVVGWFQSCA